MILVVLLGCLGAAVAQEVAAPPPTGTCMCFTTSNVNIRDAPCGNVIGTGDTSVCSISRGAESTCSLSGTILTFHRTHMGWQVSDHIGAVDKSRCGNCVGQDIHFRADWVALPPTNSGDLLTLPLSRVVLHHTAGAHCTTTVWCSTQMRNIQYDHMNENGFADIGYNWCVGEDGAAYEGRGWRIQGAHASGENDVSYGICVMGNFNYQLPNTAALDAVFNLIECARGQQMLISDWTIEGHRNVDYGNECPGHMLYEWLQGHPRFNPNP